MYIYIYIQIYILNLELMCLSSSRELFFVAICQHINCRLVNMQCL